MRSRLASASVLPSRATYPAAASLSSRPRTIGGNSGLFRSGISTPTVCERRVRRLRATGFGRYPSLAAAAVTRRAVSSLTRRRVSGLSARDAVAGWTRAAAATSRSVAGRSAMTHLAPHHTRLRYTARHHQQYPATSTEALIRSSLCDRGSDRQAAGPGRLAPGPTTSGTSQGPAMPPFRRLLHSRLMWGVTFSDLIYRYRQFLIAVVGAGVVFAMALAMTGLAAGFTAEINWTIGGIGADRWVLNINAHGLISNGQLLPQADATVISESPGVTRAAGLAVLPQQVVRINGLSKTVLVFGVELGN